MKKDYVGIAYDKVDKPFTSFPQKLADHLSNKYNIKQNDKFLEIGCGRGEYIDGFSKRGINCYGVDISDYTKKQYPDIKFSLCDLINEKLPFEDNTFDYVYSKSVIEHFYHPEKIFEESFRVLKPGGKILAVEALDYNPAIKLYRMLTPDMRTEWEKSHILSLKDIKFAKRFFEIGAINYWHVVGYAAGKFPLLTGPLNMIDRILEKILYLQRLSWMFTFELIKPVE